MADCSRCFGLCCVAPAFAASADFAIDKPAGRPCPNLDTAFRCSVHAGLRERGFAGCTVYDCFGAGQRIAQVTFGGRDWRAHPADAGRMFDAFAVMRTLHELLWYLTEALTLPAARPLASALTAAFDETTRLTDLDGPGLIGIAGPFLEAHRRTVADLLGQVSALVRSGLRGRDLSRADLIGRRPRGLRGASLRGALLIGADLRGADLHLTDLIGADLRATDLRGANLSTALFLTQFQLNAATGDSHTRLPRTLTSPPHWP